MIFFNDFWLIECVNVTFFFDDANFILFVIVFFVIFRDCKFDIFSKKLIKVKTVYDLTIDDFNVKLIDVTKTLTMIFLRFRSIIFDQFTSIIFMSFIFWFIWVSVFVFSYIIEILFCVILIRRIFFWRNSHDLFHVTCVLSHATHRSKIFLLHSLWKFFFMKITWNKKHRSQHCLLMH